MEIKEDTSGHSEDAGRKFHGQKLRESERNS